jgi:hypothetical protein
LTKILKGKFDMENQAIESDYSVMHHALGITDPSQPAPYRNHFVASNGHHDMPALERLCSDGLMVEGGKPSFCDDRSRVFYVTDSGKAVAMETRPKPPKMTRSQKRYQRYLEYGDGFESFLDYLRWDGDSGRSWNGGNY